eukprot:2248332-Amphidinium_carterae.1
MTSTISTTISISKTIMMSRTASTNYCTTADRPFDYYCLSEDYVMTGEEDLFKGHYILFSDMSKI